MKKAASITVSGRLMLSPSAKLTRRASSASCARASGGMAASNRLPPLASASADSAASSIRMPMTPSCACRRARTLTQVRIVKAPSGAGPCVVRLRPRSHQFGTVAWEALLQSNRALQTLDRYHHQILAIMEQARMSLSDQDGGDVAGLAKHRWELTRVLREYQLFKHGEIFDPIVRGDLGARSRAAATLKAQCLGLGDAFAIHVRRWSLQGPASGWADYRRDATEMLGRIERHLAHEAHEVALLLDGMERTRRP